MVNMICSKLGHPFGVEIKYMTLRMYECTHFGVAKMVGEIKQNFPFGLVQLVNNSTI